MVTCSSCSKMMRSDILKRHGPRCREAKRFHPFSEEEERKRPKRKVPGVGISIMSCITPCKNTEKDVSINDKTVKEPKTNDSCNDSKNNGVADWGIKYNDFEVYTCADEKYDFSTIEYNNVIDGELRHLKANTPYLITDVRYHMKKYDIDTDRVDEVVIISLQTEEYGTFRIVAPYALTNYWEIIGDKLNHDTTLTIFREEMELIHVCCK